MVSFLCDFDDPEYKEEQPFLGIYQNTKVISKYNPLLNNEDTIQATLSSMEIISIFSRYLEENPNIFLQGHIVREFVDWEKNKTVGKITFTKTSTRDDSEKQESYNQVNSLSWVLIGYNQDLSIYVDCKGYIDSSKQIHFFEMLLESELQWPEYVGYEAVDVPENSWPNWKPISP